MDDGVVCVVFSGHGCRTMPRGRKDGTLNCSFQVILSYQAGHVSLYTMDFKIVTS